MCGVPDPRLRGGRGLCGKSRRERIYKLKEIIKGLREAFFFEKEVKGRLECV